MSEQVVLVDFENVQKLDLARLPIQARRLQCRREVHSTAAKVAPKPVLDAIAQQVVEVLKRGEKNKQLSKRKTLTPEHVKTAIDQLISAKLLGGTDSALAYNL